MKHIATLLVPAFLFAAAPAPAQVDVNGSKSATRAQVDSNYVKLFPKTTIVRTFLGEKISTFSIEDNKRAADLDFRPNNVLALGVGVTYRSVGLNVSTKLPFHDPKDDKFGDTRQYDFQLHSYRRKLAIDLYAQRYKGFHLNDLSKVTSVPGPEEYPYYPNMRIVTLGASVMYVFNGNRYSLRAPVNQQDRQLRSAGSPMVGAAFYFHQISNGDSSVIPGSYYKPEIFDASKPLKIRTYGLTVQGGYGYTWVFRQLWFIAVSADVGIGGGFVSSRETDGDRITELNLHASANARFGLGYNADRWMVGIYGIAHGDRFTLPYGESQFGSSQGVARLVVARRLKTRR